MTEKELDIVTSWLRINVFQNTDIIFNDVMCNQLIKCDDYECDVIDIIATLHNLLCESVTGKRYNYMWHHANKLGAWCNDDIFDNLLKGVNQNENN